MGTARPVSDGGGEPVLGKPVTPSFVPGRGSASVLVTFPGVNRPRSIVEPKGMYPKACLR